MKKIKIILVSILVSVILLACLGALGYFGIKTIRRSHLRTEAREAFAAKDWKKAEKLLNEYVMQDSDSEEDFVRLARVYNHFGNTGEEMRCWHRASTLNPLKPEYWDNYIASAMIARDFQHLFTTLSHKVILNAELAPMDQMLYLISAVITNRAKEAEKAYGVMLKADSKAFQKDDLARFAEFLATIRKLTDGERSEIIEQGTRSNDPFVRLEFTLLSLASLELSAGNAESILEQKETLLKQAVELNRFAMTPRLASFYFSNLRFDSVIELAEPYLADIDDAFLSILYAESCVYSGQTEKLKPLIEHFRSLGRKYKMQVAYFEALYDFSHGVESEDDLLLRMQEIGSMAQTDLANLINLQIALNNDNMEKICSTLETIMASPPFHDVQERARSAAHLYLWDKINAEPELAEDPLMGRIAKLISTTGSKDPFLMRVTIADLYKRNMLTRQILQENLDAFPQDPYLLEVAAEFELFNGNPEKCLEYVGRFYALENGRRSISLDILHMLALELTGRVDEATKEFTSLVDNTKMDRKLLYRYFRFCIIHGRQAELSKMAERLNASTVPEVKELAPFYEAEALFLQEKTEEALSLLATAKTERSDFTLFAANRFNACDRLDEALSRYLALLDKHSDKRLILANIAEIYLAKGKKAEALSYAKQAWEMDQEALIGQFVYAKMLAANGRYQDAERILRIPNRSVELPDEIKALWTDVMTHCVQEDLDNQSFQRAFDRAKHYLTLFPDDATFLDFRSRAERGLKKEHAVR